MQIFDMFGEELFVDDMVARCYTGYRTGAIEIVYIDKIPAEPGRKMRVRGVKLNTYTNEYSTSNVDYNKNKLIKLSQDQIDAALR